MGRGWFTKIVSRFAHLKDSIFELIKQVEIEANANYQRVELEMMEKRSNKNYFLHRLDEHYRTLLLSSPKNFKGIKKNAYAEQVVAVTQVHSDFLDRKLAALTRLTEKLQSDRVYIDIFSRDKLSERKNVDINPTEGVIFLSTATALKQTLTFTQPLMAPGVGRRIRRKEGPHFFTPLDFVAKKSWKIICGDTTTFADLTNVVQYVTSANGNTRPVGIDIKMGKGDDEIAASVGNLNVDGGGGFDVVDYSYLPGESVAIDVSVDEEGRYHVKKQCKNAVTHKEIISTEKLRIGKRREVIQYRQVLLEMRASVYAEDVLENVEAVVGTRGNDRCQGGNKTPIMFDAREGDDYLYGGELNDVLVGGAGNDFLVGGKGNDILQGGWDDDVYFFASGDGQDFIFDAEGMHDVLLLGEGITREQLEFREDDDNLEIHIRGSTDQIVIARWFFGHKYRVEEIRLHTKEVITQTQIEALIASMAVMPSSGVAGVTSATSMTPNPAIYSSGGLQTPI